MGKYAVFTPVTIYTEVLLDAERLSVENAVEEAPLSSCSTCDSIYAIYGRNMWDQRRGTTYAERA
jgi:hypothetical protein